MKQQQDAGRIRTLNETSTETESVDVQELERENRVLKQAPERELKKNAPTPLSVKIFGYAILVPIASVVLVAIYVLAYLAIRRLIGLT